jgi:acyl carrier protein
MMAERTEIAKAVKQYVMGEFLPDDDADALQDSTPLISGAILDSVATIKLVTFLEERYGIEIQPHEINMDYLNTISDIADLVQAKLSGKAPR